MNGCSGAKQQGIITPLEGVPLNTITGSCPGNLFLSAVFARDEPSIGNRQVTETGPRCRFLVSEVAVSESTPMTEDLSFDEARQALLEQLAEDMAWTLYEVVKAYNKGGELRRRVDIAALGLSCPTSQAIH
jgi:hypothetical protein